MPSSARTVSPRKDSKVSITEARHMMRYLRSVRGEKPEDIAKEEGITPAAVERSIRRVEISKALYAPENTLESLRRIIVNNSVNVEIAIGKGLNAKQYVRKDKVGKDGKTKTTYVAVDDTVRQLDAARVFKEIASVIQPKGPGVNVNVQQSNQTAAVVTNVRGNGFEERLERLKKQQAEFNLLPPEVAVSPVGEDEEIIDADDEDDDDEE